MFQLTILMLALCILDAKSYVFVQMNDDANVYKDSVMHKTLPKGIIDNFKYQLMESNDKQSDNTYQNSDINEKNYQNSDIFKKNYQNSDIVDKNYQNDGHFNHFDRNPSINNKSDIVKIYYKPSDRIRLLDTKETNSESKKHTDQLIPNGHHLLKMKFGPREYLTPREKPIKENLGQFKQHFITKEHGALKDRLDRLGEQFFKKEHHANSEDRHVSNAKLIQYFLDKEDLSNVRLNQKEQVIPIKYYIPKHGLDVQDNLDEKEKMIPNKYFALKDQTSSEVTKTSFKVQNIPNKYFVSTEFPSKKNRFASIKDSIENQSSGKEPKEHIPKERILKEHIPKEHISKEHIPKEQIPNISNEDLKEQITQKEQIKQKKKNIDKWDTIVKNYFDHKNTDVSKRPIEKKPVEKKHLSLKDFFAPKEIKQFFTGQFGNKEHKRDRQVTKQHRFSIKKPLIEKNILKTDDIPKKENIKGANYLMDSIVGSILNFVNLSLNDSHQDEKYKPQVLHVRDKDTKPSVLMKMDSSLIFNMIYETFKQNNPFNTIINSLLDKSVATINGLRQEVNTNDKQPQKGQEEAPLVRKGHETSTQGNDQDTTRHHRIKNKTSAQKKDTTLNTEGQSKEHDLDNTTQQKDTLLNSKEEKETPMPRKGQVALIHEGQNQDEASMHNRARDQDYTIQLKGKPKYIDKHRKGRSQPSMHSNKQEQDDTILIKGHKRNTERHRTGKKKYSNRHRKERNEGTSTEQDEDVIQFGGMKTGSMHRKSYKKYL